MEKNRWRYCSIDKMNFKTTTSKKIFPFAPKILWTLNSGKYVKPRLPKVVIDRSVKNKTIVVSAFGNIFESFFSMSLLELFSRTYNNDFLWAGRKEFIPLLKSNGLANYFEGLKEDHLKKFTTPIFMDRDDRVYFNSLYNYRDVKTYYGSKGYHCKQPVCKQIFQNSCFPWRDCVPELRGSFQSPPVDLSKKFVLIIPDQTIFSNNSISCLEFNLTQIVSLSQLLIQKGINTLIIANDPRKYYNGFVSVLPATIDNLFSLIPKSIALFSKQIDYHLISMLVSKAKLFYSFPIRQTLIREYIMHANYKYLFNQYSDDKSIVLINNMNIKEIAQNIIRDV